MIFYTDLKLSNLRDYQVKIIEPLKVKLIYNGCKKEPNNCICCSYIKGEAGEPPYLD